MAAELDTQAVLDALGHGVLIFSGRGKLVQYNIVAASILGRDLHIIREQGWDMTAELLEVGLDTQDLRLDAVKEQALKSDRPVRFRIFRSGAFVPCSAAAVNSRDGDVYIVLTLDVPDWSVVNNVIDRFRHEMYDAVDSTVGHIKLINRTLQRTDDDQATQKVGKRIGGFTRLIETHMSRAGRLVAMLDRLQDIRIGLIKDKTRNSAKKIDFADYMEDFLEALDEIQLLDPESEHHDYRSRVQLDIQGDIQLRASEQYLTLILREILRNAIMYSLVGTPLHITAQKKQRNVQIDITDDGYGIRDKERERVFEVFQRARQPQIIAEFGYGLALHLCKYEIEAMKGRIWLTGEEGVGTTVHILLPAWRDPNVTQTAEAPAITSQD